MATYPGYRHSQPLFDRGRRAHLAQTRESSIPRTRPNESGRWVIIRALMALTSGTKLGPYEIQSSLGSGGMGEVYRARDTRLGREVAIKVLPEHLRNDPNLKTRFEREARAISALSHSHICHLYDVGSQAGTDYLVM